MLKVLLVDDEKFTIQGLIALLDWEQFDGKLVGTAASGEEALELVDILLPDIIISDIKMGGMSGIELARIVYEKEPSIQMILLTAHGEFQYAQKAIQYGVIDYILKPITRNKIEKLTQLLIQKNQQKVLKRSSYLFTWDDELKNKLLDALRNRRRDILDEFFQSSQFEEFMAGSEGNTIGIQLINYLYIYLEEINIQQDALQYSRNETIAAFLDINGLQYKMDFLITKYYDLLTSISTQPRPSHTDAIASYALSYIKEHYTDTEFNLSGLSYAMHVSLSYLSTVFKQATGNNLSAYVTELRLDRAKSLLPDLQYPISEVALLSGYNDAKYFAKLFKKHTGKTPGEYRNLLIKGGLHGI